MGILFPHARHTAIRPTGTLASHEGSSFSSISSQPTREYQTSDAESKAAFPAGYTSNQSGLFSSSKQLDTEKTPKLKRLKSNRNIRTKKQSAKDILTIAKPRENILSETLEVKIVFEGDPTIPSILYLQPRPQVTH